MIGSVIALARREATRDLSEKGRLLFDIAWPLMVLIVLGLGVDAFARPKAGLSYAAFLGAGIIGLLVIRQCASFARSLEREARYGYREYLVTPVPRRWIIIGSFMGKWFTQSIIALIVLAAYAGAMQVSDPASLALSVIAVIVSVGAGLAAGLALSVIVMDMQQHSLKSWIIVIALALISGVFFPVTDLPFGLEYLAYLSPLTYIVDSIRGALLGVSIVGVWLSLGIVAAVGAACFCLGMWKSAKLFRID